MSELYFPRSLKPVVSKGFLLDDDDWNKAAKKWLTRLLREKVQLQQLCTGSRLALRPLLLYAREALMLADHFVSSQKHQTDVPIEEQKKVLYANNWQETHSWRYGSFSIDDDRSFFWKWSDDLPQS